MEVKVVDKIQDLNCTTCIYSKKINSEHWCYFPRDIDERQEVDRSDRCGQQGLWIINYEGSKREGPVYACDYQSAIEILYMQGLSLPSSVTQEL